MGLTDLLPEFETPIPQGSGFAAEQKKNFGLRERICTTCGGRFVLSAGQVGYRRNVQGKELPFCSWTCLRKDERERVLVKAGRRKGARKSIEQKRADMEKRNAKDREFLASPKGKRLTAQERRRIQSRISDRVRKFERSVHGA